MKGSEKSSKKSSWRRSRTKQMQLRLHWPGSSQETAGSIASAASPLQENNSRKGTNGSRIRRSEGSIDRPAPHKRRRQKQCAGSSSKSRLDQRKDPLVASTESTQMWVDKYAPLKSTDLVVAPKKVKEINTWLEEALTPGNCKFLILVGSPGIGKSTAVHCLAREMDLEVVEWRESLSVAWQPNADASIEYESPIRSFESS